MNIETLPTSIFIKGDAKTREIRIDGKLLMPETSMAVRMHSLDGFNWGYGGSGPAQLALAILLEFMDANTAINFYQDFKWLIVSEWPMKSDFEIQLNLKRIIQIIAEY